MCDAKEIHDEVIGDPEVLKNMNFDVSIKVRSFIQICVIQLKKKKKNFKDSVSQFNEKGERVYHTFMTGEWVSKVRKSKTWILELYTSQ